MIGKKMRKMAKSLRRSKKPKFNLEYTALHHYLKEKNIAHPTLQDVYHAVIAIRQSKLPNPKEMGNAGSFFKNPIISKTYFENLKKNYPTIPSFNTAEETVKIPAAWLIEQSGFKGKRFGDAGVHQHQALVLVNYGHATGQQILQLSKEIQSAVFEKFNIELIPEVNIF